MRKKKEVEERIAQREKVAALAHMTETGKETHRRFHSSIITIRINDTAVDIEALDDSGAFAGFAPDSAVPYDIPRVHDHRPTGTASTASGGSLGPSTGRATVNFTLPESSHPDMTFDYEVECIDNDRVPFIIGVDFFDRLGVVKDYRNKTLLLRKSTAEGVIEVVVPFRISRDDPSSTNRKPDDIMKCHS